VHQVKTSAQLCCCDKLPDLLLLVMSIRLFRATESRCQSRSWCWLGPRFRHDTSQQWVQSSDAITAAELNVSLRISANNKHAWRCEIERNHFLLAYVHPLFCHAGLSGSGNHSYSGTTSSTQHHAGKQAIFFWFILDVPSPKD
jgi:hypothetical protein